MVYVPDLLPVFMRANAKISMVRAKSAPIMVQMISVFLRSRSDFFDLYHREEDLRTAWFFRRTSCNLILIDILWKRSWSKSKEQGLLLGLWSGLSLWLGRSIAEVDPIGYVSFICAPGKKVIKNRDAIIFSDYFVSIEVIILGHLVNMLFYKIVDVFAEEIHVGVP